MTIAIQKSRVLILALLLAVATIFGVGALSPALPKAQADDDFEMILAAQAWADLPCTYSVSNNNAIQDAMSTLKNFKGYLSERDLWRVIAIGTVSGCPHFLNAPPFMATYLPDLAPHLGPWMYSNRDGYGMNTAYRDYGNVCNVLVSQGAEAAVNSMYSTPVSPAPRPEDAKKAAVVGTMTFCPWNLGILRAYYGG